jgi:hypothetical protein
MLVTINDYKIALKNVREYPESHGYSKEECESVLSFEKEMKEYSHKLTSSFKKTGENLTRAFANFQFSPCKFVEAIQDTSFVVTHDWYISFNLLRNSTLDEIFRLLHFKEKESLQNFVIKNFPLEKDTIFKFIHKTIPHRTSLISEIEGLFKNNFYSAVVALCYTQVDGICNENIGYGFFDTDQNHNLKISKLEPNESLASKIAFQLKESRNEINRYVKPEINNKTFKLNSFNRHLVIHGHSIHFGTELNAIRAILLLDFVCSLIKEGVISK